jgi:hypothetical protein
MIFVNIFPEIFFAVSLSARALPRNPSPEGHPVTDPAPQAKPAAPTVRQLIRLHYAALTQSERRFANALLENYPGAGLSSITAAAEGAGVSAPVVARLVQKLGFKGYPQFHQALLAELQAKVSGPAERRAVWAAEAPSSHLLNRRPARWPPRRVSMWWAGASPARSRNMPLPISRRSAKASDISPPRRQAGRIT